jgi:heme-degrading monooxygenase HmoA
MYAVIFKAKVKSVDSQYSEMAKKLRKLALSEYKCIEFIACTEGNNEIAISYWHSLAHIEAWRKNPEHIKAQAIGKSKWYESYQVQVSKILR